MAAGTPAVIGTHMAARSAIIPIGLCVRTDTAAFRLAYWTGCSNALSSGAGLTGSTRISASPAVRCTRQEVNARSAICQSGSAGGYTISIRTGLAGRAGISARSAVAGIGCSIHAAAIT
jgi:hypothetical protein